MDMMRKLISVLALLGLHAILVSGNNDITIEKSEREVEAGTSPPESYTMSDQQHSPAFIPVYDLLHLCRSTRQNTL